MVGMLLTDTESFNGGFLNISEEAISALHDGKHMWIAFQFEENYHMDYFRE